MGVAVKFAMGGEVLGTLTTRTSSAGDELGALVRQLGEAAEPLQGKFNGAGRTAFDNFKVRTDEIAIELNRALNSVLEGIAGMDRSFTEADSQMSDEIRSSEGASSFEAARFGSKG